MGELVLVRHGQASFGTDDYDRLSELGFEQARHLGNYFRERDIEFDRIVCGTQRRHRQTLDGTALLAATQEPDFLSGLNEFDFYGVFDAYVKQFPPAVPLDRTNVRDFFSTLRKALPVWSEGQLIHQPEPWDNFQTRIRDSLQNLIADNSAERVLVISSGGPISALMREVLQLSVRHMMDINLQTANTSVTKLQFKNGKARLQSFNGLPHLDHPSTSHLITLT
jgi:broad specificity phosphatase PhoE